MEPLLPSCFFLFACIIRTVNGMVWPVSGTVAVDMPQTSPFGPRLLTNQGSEFDFHRGIDIPADIGTPVYAITDGVVRLAGNYSFYEDPVIQINHPGTTDNHGLKYYANYQHMSVVFVEEDEEVVEGQLLGATGASASGFEHLHFEIRNNSIFQQFSVNPWGLLPYSDTASHTVEVLALDCSPSNDTTESCSVQLAVTQAYEELDLNSFEVLLLDEGGQPLEHTRTVYDFNAMNAATDVVSDLDEPLQTASGGGGVWVWPANEYSATLSTRDYDVVFYDVLAEVRVGGARGEAVDLKGNVVADDWLMEVAPPTETCEDGTMNQDETGVDCGGAVCAECPPSCNDGTMNQDETGVDCGGAVCAECPPSCNDGTMNQDETGVDCGGAVCDACDDSPPMICSPASGGDAGGEDYCPEGQACVCSDQQQEEEGERRRLKGGRMKSKRKNQRLPLFLGGGSGLCLCRPPPVVVVGDDGGGGDQQQ